MTLAFRLSDLYLIQKEKLAVVLFHTGMLIAFLGSLNPWFMWSLTTLYRIPAAMLLAASYLVSKTMEKPIFTRTDYLLPLLAFLLFVLYEGFSSGGNINNFIMIAFRAVIMFCLFSIDTKRLLGLTTFIAKFMGGILTVSLAGYFLYLTGFPLPGRDAQFGEFYSFTNYYLLLVNDNDLFALVPRFQSYFIEPSHIGSASAFLLFTQRGHWKRWYNIVLFATIAFSFSLGAYVYITAIIFLNLWIKKKKLFKKLLVVLMIFAAAITTAFTYNNGDNLVHDLILLRLEVDDGELAGDNRVTGNFEKDYENFLGSADIVFGRQMEIVEFGNAGYKPFFYDHGLVGIMLIFSFYFIAMWKSSNKRAVVSALIVAILYFIVSAFMLSEKVFISLYAAAYRDDEKPQKIPHD